MEKIEIIQLSSLAKVFPTKIYGNVATKGEIAKGQSFSYQISVMIFSFLVRTLNISPFLTHTEPRLVNVTR